MLYLFVQTFLKSGEEDFALLIFQTIGSQFDDKVIGRKHAVIEQGQDNGIDNNGPELFNQIERQRRTAIEGTVQVANKVIEADQLHGTGHFAGQQRIPETEQSIHRISWRTLDSPRKGHCPGSASSLPKHWK